MVNEIRAYCLGNKISIRDLEKELGFGNGTIYKWDDHSPSVENVKKVADFFGVTVNDILGYPETDGLNKTEELLLVYFRSLNKDGQLFAMMQIEMMANTPRYIKNNTDKTVGDIA